MDTHVGMNMLLIRSFVIAQWIPFRAPRCLDVVDGLPGHHALSLQWTVACCVGHSNVCFPLSRAWVFLFFLVSHICLTYLYCLPLILSLPSSTYPYEFCCSNLSLLSAPYPLSSFFLIHMSFAVLTYLYCLPLILSLPSSSSIWVLLF